VLQRLSAESFARLVERAMADLPAEYARLLDTVAVVVEDEPSGLLKDLNRGGENYSVFTTASLMMSHSFVPGPGPAQISLIADRFSGNATPRWRWFRNRRHAVMSWGTTSASMTTRCPIEYAALNVIVPANACDIPTPA
jgi:hypothetical protein